MDASTRRTLIDQYRAGYAAVVDALAGAPEGDQVLAKLISAVAEVWEVNVVLLDFAEVDHATSSFLRESVLNLLSY